MAKESWQEILTNLLRQGREEATTKWVLVQDPNYAKVLIPVPRATYDRLMAESRKKGTTDE